jgi:hypothetical protein
MIQAQIPGVTTLPIRANLMMVLGMLKLIAFMLMQTAFMSTILTTLEEIMTPYKPLLICVG